MVTESEDAADVDFEYDCPNCGSHVVNDTQCPKCLHVISAKESAAFARGADPKAEPEAVQDTGRFISAVRIAGAVAAVCLFLSVIPNMAGWWYVRTGRALYHGVDSPCPTSDCQKDVDGGIGLRMVTRGTIGDTIVALTGHRAYVVLHQTQRDGADGYAIIVDDHTYHLNKRGANWVSALEEGGGKQDATARFAASADRVTVVVPANADTHWELRGPEGQLLTPKPLAFDQITTPIATLVAPAFQLLALVGLGIAAFLYPSRRRTCLALGVTVGLILAFGASDIGRRHVGTILANLAEPHSFPFWLATLQILGWVVISFGLAFLAGYGAWRGASYGLEKFRPSVVTLQAERVVGALLFPVVILLAVASVDFLLANLLLGVTF